MGAHGWAESAIELRRQIRRHTKVLHEHASRFAQLKKFRNPFAIGNYINHPPKDTPSNVLSYAYNFDLKTFPEHLKPYIPYRFAEPPKWYYGDSISGRSVALVAAKPVEEGEELFLDYRYNPAFPYPEWYHP